MCEHENTSEILYQVKIRDYRGERKYEVAVCDDCGMLVNYYGPEIVMTAAEIRRLFVDIRDLTANIEGAINDLKESFSEAINPFRDID